jgi:hypothetical protein
MATIPVVQVERNIANTVAHPAIGIGLRDKDGKTYVLLDPATYQLIGQRSISYKGRPRWTTRLALGKGGVISMAWAVVALVSGPGQR